MRIRLKRSPHGFARIGAPIETEFAKPARKSCAVISVKASETSRARSAARLLFALYPQGIECGSLFSLPETAGFFIGAPTLAAALAANEKKPARGGFWSGVSKAMPRAPQRMPPVDAARSRGHGPYVVQLPVFLPQFVREKKRDDQQRNYQKGAQYHSLDHGSLRSQEHDFIVEHRAYPHRAAPLIMAAIARIAPNLQPATTRHPAPAGRACCLAYRKNAPLRKPLLQELQA